jgi:hypothetical protein
MTGKQLLGVIGILAAGGGAAILAGKGGELDAGKIKGAVELRAARLDGVCPAPTSLEAARCMGITQQDGYCICWTAQAAGAVDGEVTSVIGRPGKDRARLVVCTEAGEVVPHWQKSDAAVSINCTAAASDVLMPGVSANGLELGDVEAKLRVSCAPCPVTAGSWGRCPECIREPGGCAAACPVRDGGIP